ncbi:MAG: hypothetical protein ACRCXC_05690 [Legionella sp.]
MSSYSKTKETSSSEIDPGTQSMGWMNANLRALSRHVLSVDDLEQLLKIDGLSEDLIIVIIEHSLCDESVMSYVLSLSADMSERLLLMLVDKCKTKREVDLFFKRAVLPESFLYTLLTLDTLNKMILRRFSMRPDLSDELISEIIVHPLCEDTVRVALLNTHDNLSEHLLLLLIDKCQTTEELSKIASRNDLNESVIGAVLDKTPLLDSEILL